mmetsp:Transcript_66924/g.105920  ORF Transcript_66924/g.105920 Transcript_66924/m.105920 type:complete len:102 (+) Transcript_66924:588-893(+)
MMISRRRSSLLGLEKVFHLYIFRVVLGSVTQTLVIALSTSLKLQMLKASLWHLRVTVSRIKDQAKPAQLRSQIVRVAMEAIAVELATYVLTGGIFDSHSFP